MASLCLRALFEGTAEHTLFHFAFMVFEIKYRSNGAVGFKKSSVHIFVERSNV